MANFPRTCTIPDDTLTAWARQGAVEASKRTHEAVRAALDAYSWPAEYSYAVFLEGRIGTTRIFGATATWTLWPNSIPHSHWISRFSASLNRRHSARTMPMILSMTGRTFASMS